MGKPKLSDTLALDPNKQKTISKQIRKVKKKIQKGEIEIKEQRKAEKITAEQKRGLIFISHLPHGFYEDELKKYFQQFGKVTNVKVCRSNRTGRSKGYGYVEFSHPEVAKIAGETMNNYLMFKKRLSVDYIPYDKRPTKLFHGKSSTDTKYSAKTRRNKQFQANERADDETLTRRVRKRCSRLSKKIKKLNDLGIKVPLEISREVSVENEVVTSHSKSKSKTPTRKQNVLELDSNTSNHDSTKPTNTESDSLHLTKKGSKKSLSRSDRLSETNLDTSVNILKPSSTKKLKNNLGINKRKKQTSKAISNKNTDLSSLNAVTVRKIARELIRKKGRSLLKFQSPNSDSKPQKTKKK